jgi:sulfate adenylyltransferase
MPIDRWYEGDRKADRSVSLIQPYGGSLVDLTVPADEAVALKAAAAELPSVQLSKRCACDLELLATGAFSPLDRFMSERDYERVLADMRLAGGHLFPVPVTLAVDEASRPEPGSDVALRDIKGDLLAVMTVEEVYPFRLEEYCHAVLGTTDAAHPLVAEAARWGRLNISGRLRVMRVPAHQDFRSLRLTPREVRERLAGIGRDNVVALQTRNPLHRVHEELARRAAQQVAGTLLLQPVVGLTEPGDTDHYTRVRSYQAVVDRAFTPGSVVLALMPLAMRLAGPREALWHAIIRRNYGANHFIVGRDHAGPGLRSDGRPFYGPYEAQQLIARHASEIGVRMVAFKELVYLPDEDRYVEADQIPAGARVASISGSEVRNEYLEVGRPLPEWFTRPEVAAILAEAYRPRYQQGVCVWFTGLSGAGKSTTAEVLTVLLAEHGRRVTLLDGDVVRTHLSKGLGFSREDRDTNIRRIGFVAAEIVRHGGVAVCAAVSPYLATREEVRNMVGREHFIEVFVDTPIQVCEQRDTKGMYAKARRGEIRGFTGVDDPYEPPQHAEIVLDTCRSTADENAARIVELLQSRAFLRPAPPRADASAR